MSDPLSGTGSQIGLTPQQLNVPPGSAVRFQHVLTTGTQNLNLLSTGGQQFVITSQVSVPGLTQVRILKFFFTCPLIILFFG